MVKVPQYEPEMKIVGISDTVSPINNVLNDICAQNDIDVNHIKLIRDYTIDVTRRIYRNVTIKLYAGYIDEVHKHWNTIEWTTASVFRAG